MSSVRERLVAAARANEIDIVRPTVFSGVLQAGTGMSTRERAERAASEAAEDKVVKLDPRQHSGLTTAISHPSSLRMRLAKEEFERSELKTKSGSVNAVEAEEERCRRAQVRNAALFAEGERKRQERLLVEQAEAQRRELERIEKQRMLAVDVALGSATPAEVRQVKDIIARNFPADRYSPERHWMVLQNLRDAVGVSESKSKPGLDGEFLGGNL